MVVTNENLQQSAQIIQTAVASQRASGGANLYKENYLDFIINIRGKIPECRSTIQTIRLIPEAPIAIRTVRH